MSNFTIEDTVGAWVPHGHFVIEPEPVGPTAAQTTPLAGLSFVAKDIFDVAGHPTGAGNPDWLATHAVPTEHSAAVAQLLQAGATLMGKVLTDELAYSLHGDNHHYGAPINSAAPDRVTGGSSSGTAAAVAARLVDFGLGTDTGGSTRVPASYCGLWGLRTTHGLVSCAGLVPLHPMFDTVTWLAHEARCFEAVSKVLLPSSDFVPRKIVLFSDAMALAEDVFAGPVQRLCQALQAMLGLRVESRPAAPEQDLTQWRQAYAVAGAFDGWQTHGPWITRQQPKFGAAVAARWRNASQTSAEAAASARAEGARIRADVRALLGDDSIAVLPSAASFAPLRNADPAAVDAVRLRTMAITCIAGLAGLPQVSLPMRSAEGLPLGVSLLGPAGSDLALVNLACSLQEQLR